MPGTHEEIVDGHERMIETKEDVKDLIDKSKNLQELYNNAINVLANMESNFKDFLFFDKYENDTEKRMLVNMSSFDDKLDTHDPLTLFEKKGKELIEKAKSMQENLYVQSLGSQVIEFNDLDFNTEKNKLIEELWQTRTEAIKNIEDDMADGFLDDEKNISRKDLLDYGKWDGENMFMLKESDLRSFENTVKNLNLIRLIFTTFNIEKGSSAFAYCYGKVEEKLGNENLFDFIDKQKKSGD